jgi:hypothetical protein
MNEEAKIQITKKQFTQLVEQFKKNPNLEMYSKPEKEYFQFNPKKGTVLITLYKFDKKYYMEIFA